MPGKILDSSDNVIFEFEDGQPIEILLSGLIQRAKFGERFDNDILSNPWINELHKALLDSMPKTPAKQDVNFGAPDYFISDGMTQNDWGLRNFFNDITLHLSHSPDLLIRKGWAKMNASTRQAFLRQVIFPNQISDLRLNDMIEDIDMSLQQSASALNPDC